MKLIFQPSISQFKCLKSWLVEEDTKLKEGFYCNWEIIKKAYSENRLIAFSNNDRLLGFIVWSSWSEGYIDIDIMEIHYEFRKIELGKTFLNLFIDHFIEETDYFAIKLYSSPKESAHFWRKMNFIELPFIQGEKELSFYKPLTKINIPVNKTNLSAKLELWDKEPYPAKEFPPKWTWDISDTSTPIIHPCHYDWFMRLTINNKIVREEKVKYFSDNHKIDYSPFLYIKNPLSLHLH